MASRQKKSRVPRVYVVAGPNGSGKTTFAKEFLPSYAQCEHFVNADLIAAGLEPFAPEKAALKAGKLVLTQIVEFADKKVDFAFESTLSGLAYAPFLQKLKLQGYEIHIFFLWIPSEILAMARIRERVKQGGHNVPSADVKRRYKKSIENFRLRYKTLADYWFIIDNSTEAPSIVAQGAKQETKILNPVIFKNFS